MFSAPVLLMDGYTLSFDMLYQYHNCIMQSEAPTVHQQQIFSNFRHVVHVLFAGQPL